MAEMSSTVLVTGYESFLNYTFENPAELVAEALNGTCNNRICYTGWRLPVTREGAKRPAALAVGPDGGSHFDAIIHLGLEDAARGLRVETAAANVLASSTSEEEQAPIEYRRGVEVLQGGEGTDPKLLAMGKLLMVGEVRHVTRWGSCWWGLELGGHVMQARDGMRTRRRLKPSETA